MSIRIQLEDPDPDQGSHTNADHADPDPGCNKRLNFYMKNKLKVDTIIGQKHTYEGTKASILEGRKQLVLVNFHTTGSGMEKSGSGMLNIR